MENACTLSGIPPHSQTGPEPPPNLAAALDYFDRGFQVIPVVPGTKKSAVKWDPWLNGLTREVLALPEQESRNGVEDGQAGVVRPEKPGDVFEE